MFRKIGGFFKWLWHFLIDFFKSVWRIIVSLKTVKEIVALLISIMIYGGWAIAFIVIGTIFPKYAWMIGVGMGVIVFWAGPFTPFWGLTIATTIIIQRYILRDKKTQTFKEIYKQFLQDREMSKDEERFMKRMERKEEKKRKKSSINVHTENEDISNINLKVEAKENDQDSTSND